MEKFVKHKLNPSANVFIFGDFNVHHKDWLTYSGGTDRSGKLCNFSISSDLTQMVNFPIRIADCDSHSPSLLDLFISPNASICSAMAFSPLGFHHIHNGMLHFIALLMTILVLIEMVFVII